MLKLVCIIFLSKTVVFSVKVEDYCKINKLNTPCLYQCKKSAKCGDPSYEFTYLTDAERLVVLNYHNKLRNEVAGGVYAKKFLPPAQDMNVLSYDKEAEFLASCFIKQCEDKHDFKRMNLEGANMGQNIHHLYANKDFKVGRNFLEKGIQRWFDEIKYVNQTNYEAWIRKFVQIKNAGHLSQMIWSRSLYIGCAKLHHKRKDHTYTLICNYLPAGNIIGGRIYKIGKPSCKEKNVEFPNLCGKIRVLSEDDFKCDLNKSSNLKCFSMIFVIILIFRNLGFY